MPRNLTVPCSVDVLQGHSGEGILCTNGVSVTHIISEGSDPQIPIRNLKDDK